MTDDTPTDTPAVEPTRPVEITAVKVLQGQLEIGAVNSGDGHYGRYYQALKHGATVQLPPGARIKIVGVVALSHVEPVG